MVPVGDIAQEYLEFYFSNAREQLLKGKKSDYIFISEELGYEKPNPKFFDKVFEAIGDYDKSEVMIIGDSLTSDMQTGNNMGIKCCWFNVFDKANDKKVKLDYIIHDLIEISKFI